MPLSASASFPPARPTDPRAAGALSRLRRIAEAPDVEAAFAAFCALADDFGFDGAMLAALRSEEEGLALAPPMAAGPLAGGERDYRAAGLHAGDPLPRRVAAASGAFSMSGWYLDPTPRRDGPLLPAIIAAMRDNGVGFTAAIPVVGPRSGLKGLAVVSGPLALGARGFDATFAAAEWLLRLGAQEVALRALALATAEPEIRLTAGERSALEGLSAGRRAEEIATLSGRSVWTVRHQIESARRRLGARTPVEAVATAIRLGLLR